jgi:DNA-binding NtrC family response regulator
MSEPLHVLLVEDSEADAEILIQELVRGGYDVIAKRVDTACDLLKALQADTWDIVLSDYNMPSFTAPDALALLRKTDLDIPFIIVSGTIGEETAVASLKALEHALPPKAGFLEKPFTAHALLARVRAALDE